MVGITSIATARLLSTLLAGGLVLSATTGVQASDDDDDEAPRVTAPGKVLPVGGRTIGGPGFWTGNDPSIGFPAYAGPLATVCVTVTNVGANPVKFAAIGGVPGGDLALSGETVTKCVADTESVRLLCETGAGTCRAYWRVDLMDVVSSP